MTNTAYNYSDLLSLIKTTLEAQHALQEIDILMTHLYRIESGAPDEILAKYVSHDFAVSLIRSFKRNNVSWQEQEQTKDFLFGLKKSIEALKVLKLTLAFKPASHMVLLFSGRVRAELGQYILLDFSYDPSIMGGAIISFQGVYKNFTLKKRIADVFEKQREKIWSIIQ